MKELRVASAWQHTTWRRCCAGWGVRTTILMSEIWVEIRRHGAAGEENTNNRQKMPGSGET